jgi:hypothetical protein
LTNRKEPNSTQIKVLKYIRQQEKKKEIKNIYIYIYTSMAQFDKRESEKCLEYRPHEIKSVLLLPGYQQSESEKTKEKV